MRRKPKFFILLLVIFLIGFWMSQQRAPSNTPEIAPAPTSTLAAVTNKVASSRTPKPSSAAPSITNTNSAHQKAFAQKLRTTLTELPKKQDLQKLGSEAAHQTPSVVLDAGRALGEVAEAVQKDPSLIPQAQDFYRACALDESKADSVRALCLSHIEKGQNGTVAGVPDRIRRLSQSLSF